MKDGLTYFFFIPSQLLLSWINNANRFHPEWRASDRGSPGTQVGCWSITIPAMKVRVRIRFIIPDINRMLFVSGVMWLTSRTKMTMTKACIEGKGIDVVINYSTAPPSLGLAYFVIIEGDKAGKWEQSLLFLIHKWILYESGHYLGHASLFFFFFLKQSYWTEWHVESTSQHGMRNMLKLHLTS